MEPLVNDSAIIVCSHQKKIIVFHSLIERIDSQNWFRENVDSESASKNTLFNAANLLDQPISLN